MVYTKNYPPKPKPPKVYEYHITLSPILSDVYDQIEEQLCGGLDSGFGRNLDALYDLLSGNFGLLNDLVMSNNTHPCIIFIHFHHWTQGSSKLHSAIQHADHYISVNALPIHLVIDNGTGAGTGIGIGIGIGTS